MGEERKSHHDALVEVGRTATASALVKAEAAGDATVIVVGTSGESPIRGAILGSTPHKLLHIANRPVLCVPVKG